MLIGPDGDLYQLSDDQLIQLQVEYDDPSTPELEVEPTRSGYRPAFSVLDGANGVVWAGGDQRLARILAGPPGSPARAEGFWFRRSLSQALRDRTYKHEVFGEPEITAISAVCPDRAVIGWREVRGATLSDEPNLEASISVLTAALESECDPEATELTLCERDSLPLDASMSEVNEDRPRLLGFADSGRIPIASPRSFDALGFAESDSALLFGGGRARLHFQPFRNSP
ncbi:MAG: hypothetical protein HYV07_10180 [Deltaproteobacteria bacterium]|nr:hypothetical protein [Deltaproteobacteria bacterium]